MIYLPNTLILTLKILSNAILLMFVFREIRDDIEQEDVQEAFFRYMEENPNAGVIQDEDDDVEYDEDGNPILKHKVTQENK